MIASPVGNCPSFFLPACPDLFERIDIFIVKLSVPDLSSMNQSCLDVFDEYANLTSLHYALTTRDDSRYWQDRLNQNYKIDFKKLKNVSLRGTIGYFKR